MSNAVVLTGMVLNAMPINDYDKRIIILTKERGKITAFARGAKRPNSQLLAATNPFVFGEFELFEGKSAYNLTKATVTEYFRDLSMNPDIAYTGFYFLEFAELFCQENSDEREMLKLLYVSLKALLKPSLDRRLVRAVFELKAIAINGQGPNVFSCMKCKSTDKLFYFSIKKGGVFCENCAKDIPAKVISADTRYTMHFVLATEIKRLYTFTVSEEILIEFSKIMKDYLDFYVHHKFKTLEILDDSNSFF